MPRGSLPRTRSSLHLKRVLQTESPRHTSGRDYARAWGIVAYLYAQGQSPRGYMDALVSRTEGWRTLFERTLLDTSESLGDFDRAVQNWIDP